MNHDTDDPVLSITQIAAILRTTEEKAVRTIRSNSLTPIRTTTGVGYLASDIDKIGPNRPFRPGREEL